MEIPDELLDKLADLAQLEIKPEEKAPLANDLRQMLEFVDQLQQIDTSGVEPLFHMSNSWVPESDRASETGMSKELLEQNAPDYGEDGFRVPKVVKK